MLDEDTFNPRPTFLINVMFRRLVKKYRYKSDLSQLSQKNDLNLKFSNSDIRVHTFCSANLKGALTVVLINPSDLEKYANI